MRILALLFPLAVFAVQFATARNIPSDVESKLEERPKSLVFLGSVDGKSYFADNTTRTWTQADNFCKSMDMKLATITTVTQRQFLQNLNSDSFFRYHWIGAFESRKATELAWGATRVDLSPSVFPVLHSEDSIKICGAIDVYLRSGYLDLSFVLCTSYYKVLCEV